MTQIDHIDAFNKEKEYPVFEIMRKSQTCSTKRTVYGPYLTEQCKTYLMITYKYIYTVLNQILCVRAWKEGVRSHYYVINMVVFQTFDRFLPSTLLRINFGAISETGLFNVTLAQRGSGHEGGF